MPETTGRRLADRLLQVAAHLDHQAVQAALGLGAVGLHHEEAQRAPGDPEAPLVPGAVDTASGGAAVWPGTGLGERVVARLHVLEELGRVERAVQPYVDDEIGNCAALRAIQVVDGIDDRLYVANIGHAVELRLHFADGATERAGYARGVVAGKAAGLSGGDERPGLAAVSALDHEQQDQDDRDHDGDHATAD